MHMQILILHLVIYFVALGLPFKRSVWQAGRQHLAGSCDNTAEHTQKPAHSYTHAYTQTDRNTTHVSTE